MDTRTLTPWQRDILRWAIETVQPGTLTRDQKLALLAGVTFGDGMKRVRSVLSIVTGLSKGREYELAYMIPGVQRVPHYARMSFIGFTTTGQLQFNARPTAGTQTWDIRWIQAVTDVGASIGRDDPRRYTDGRP